MDFFDLVKTDADRKRLRGGLREVRMAVAADGSDLEQEAAKYLQADEAKVVLAMLKKRKGEEGFHELLEKLDKSLGKMPMVELVLANKPTKELRDKIIDWVRDNSDKKVVFKFSEEADLQGGVVVFTGGRRGDYSVRKRLAEL